MDLKVALAALATIYGVVGVMGPLMQARLVLRRRSSDDVSMSAVCILSLGYVVWLAYGISINSLPLIVVDALGMITGSLCVFLVWRYRMPRRQPTLRAGDRQLRGNPPSSWPEMEGMLARLLPAEGVAVDPDQPGGWQLARHPHGFVLSEWKADGSCVSWDSRQEGARLRMLSLSPQVFAAFEARG